MWRRKAYASVFRRMEMHLIAATVRAHMHTRTRCMFPHFPNAHAPILSTHTHTHTQATALRVPVVTVASSRVPTKKWGLVQASWSAQGMACAIRRPLTLHPYPASNVHVPTGMRDPHSLCRCLCLCHEHSPANTHTHTHTHTHRWTGGDCSERICPAGRAWFSYPTSNEDSHSQMIECSGFGNCDIATGRYESYLAHIRLDTVVC